MTRGLLSHCRGFVSNSSVDSILPCLVSGCNGQKVGLSKHGVPWTHLLPLYVANNSIMDGNQT